MNFTRIDQVTATVLVIESDPLMLTAMGSVMNMQGYRAVLARTEDVANVAIADQTLDVIVLSINELESGCHFAHRLRSHATSSDTPIIFLVPELKAEWTEKLSAQGGVYSLLKPIDPHGLLELVDRVLWMPHLARSRGTAPENHLNMQADWIRLN
ncbi:response regulator [Aureliella helgolandensis]|uniref:Response regulator receiver domain protein n=1 Tax=Aureliella helgolandensis TaxID=2527968 RepID=A0A518G1D7_9BACT|nr:response regulator [Aureliella helgolandensis]QDV22412.1 Response regulator receiver domain protein [Aureliella helgolandensis]